MVKKFGTMESYAGRWNGEQLNVDTALEGAVAFNCYENYCGEDERYVQIYLEREQVEALHKQLGKWLGAENG